MTLIADIFVTIKPTTNRISLTLKSLNSLLSNTNRDTFRLTLCFDGPEFEYRTAAEEQADYVLSSKQNEGLGPTINRAVSHIKSINDWYSDATFPDQNQVAPFIVMLQDDIKYSKDWLPKLAGQFLLNENIHKLGFASGIECVEHATKKVIVPNQIVLKDWIRATCMFGRREYWESLMPIPRFDPETGRVRAKPNDGMGSGVDWHVIRNHENSVCKTGRTCLVMPGLLQHIGFNASTWLKREMPESDSDKEKMK